MGQSHTVTALRDKRAELGGVIVDLERRIVRHRAELARDRLKPGGGNSF
jgi:hypothetical protein